jgi:hypothetical protein
MLFSQSFEESAYYYDSDVISGIDSFSTIDSIGYSHFWLDNSVRKGTVRAAANNGNFFDK